MSDFTLKMIGLAIMTISILSVSGYLVYAVHISTKYVTDAMKK